MLTFFSLILGIMTGFGLVTLTFALMLDKSNNIGDSVGEVRYYSKRPKFYKTLDQGSDSSCQDFARYNSVDIHRDYEDPDRAAEVCRFDPSEMKIAAKKNKPSTADNNKRETILDDQYDFDSLPEVDKPLFKPKD